MVVVLLLEGCRDEAIKDSAITVFSYFVTASASCFRTRGTALFADTLLLDPCAQLHIHLAGSELRHKGSSVGAAFACK